LSGLERSHSAKKVKAAATDKFWFVAHALLLLGFAVFYYLIDLKLIPLSQAQVELSHRLVRGFALVVIVFVIAKSVRIYGIGRIEDSATRFTLRRILLLVAGFLIAVIAVSVVFVYWYPAVAAHGVKSACVVNCWRERRWTNSKFTNTRASSFT
jgi:hypothetical protein